MFNHIQNEQYQIDWQTYQIKIPIFLNIFVLKEWIIFRDNFTKYCIMRIT